RGLGRTVLHHLGGPGGDRDRAAAGRIHGRGRGIRVQGVHVQRVGGNRGVAGEVGPGRAAEVRRGGQRRDGDDPARRSIDDRRGGRCRGRGDLHLVSAAGRQ